MDRIVLISQYAQDSLNLMKYAAAEFLERQTKKSEAAEKFLDIFKKQNKLSFKAGIIAATIYMQLDKYEESEVLFNRIIQNYSEKEDIDQVYFLLGELYFLQKKYKHSLENFQQILLRYPSSLSGRSQR